MTKPEAPANPAERGPHTLTDAKPAENKDPQLEGNRRPDRDLPRGSEPSTRGTSHGQR